MMAVALLLFIGCRDEPTSQVKSSVDLSPEGIATRAESALIFTPSSNGMFYFTIKTPFVYGDVVEFESANGKERGNITEITILDDGNFHYTVYIPKKDILQSGIYADEMKLVKRTLKHNLK